MTKENSNPENLPEKKKGKQITDVVLSKIKVFQQKNELDLPPNYSASNALKSAWLILQETADKDKRPALSVCTKESVANALLDMVVQGLNPAKRQCYFIVYGKKLALQRSYFGTKAVCLRVDKSISDIYAEVVYQGDELEYEIRGGRRIITDHRQRLENIDDSKILAAYAVATGKDGEVKRSELMTIDQIKMAWMQSKMRPIDEKGNIKPGSTHGKFTAEMAKKTVTSRLAKHIINTSADADLLIQTIRRNDDMRDEMDADMEADQYANQEVIDIEPSNQDRTQENEKQVDEYGDDDSWMDDDQSDGQQEQKSKPSF